MICRLLTAVWYTTGKSKGEMIKASNHYVLRPLRKNVGLAAVIVFFLALVKNQEA